MKKRWLILLHWLFLLNCFCLFRRWISKKLSIFVVFFVIFIDNRFEAKLCFFKIMNNFSRKQFNQFAKYRSFCFTYRNEFVTVQIQKWIFDFINYTSEWCGFFCGFWVGLGLGRKMGNPLATLVINTLKYLLFIAIKYGIKYREKKSS